MMGPNTATEIHAIWNGWFRSIKSFDPRPTTDDSEAEPHYFRLGYILGDLTQYLLLYAGYNHFPPL